MAFQERDTITILQKLCECRFINPEVLELDADSEGEIGVGGKPIKADLDR